MSGASVTGISEKADIKVLLYSGVSEYATQLQTLRVWPGRGPGWATTRAGLISARLRHHIRELQCCPTNLLVFQRWSQLQRSSADSRSDRIAMYFEF